MKIVLLLLGALHVLNANHSFYVGATLGLGTFAGKRSDSVTNATPVTAVLANNKGVYSKGVYWGMLAGYLFRIENFGVGPEFFYNYGKLEDKINGTHNDQVGPFIATFDVIHKITNQYGANIRLGYFLESYFLYTLLGTHCQTSSFQVNAKHVDAIGNFTQYEYRPKKKKTSVFNFGFGVQKSITENYAIGLECKFARLPKKNFAFNLNDPNETKLTSSLKYQMRSISLKLMYIF